MTKAELVEKVANQINLTKKQTEVVVNTVFSSITESLAEGKKVELRGFGSFRIRQRNARVGRNPKSGQKVDVPSKKVPFFKAGKELRELVDEKQAQDDAKADQESLKKGLAACPFLVFQITNLAGYPPLFQGNFLFFNGLASDRLKSRLAIYCKFPQQL